MMATIQLPYSKENVVVESHQVRNLMNLSIVSMTVKGKVINLTPESARELGTALLDASIAETETTQPTRQLASLRTERASQ